jgi:siroheme synthase-like protein
VNAVDDPANASAFLSGVVRRGRVTIAISTRGDAPALTSLLREGIDALLPRDLAAWTARARAARIGWRREAVPMDARKPALLRALNSLYDTGAPFPPAAQNDKSFAAAAPRIPWLNAPEDSWL